MDRKEETIPERRNVNKVLSLRAVLGHRADLFKVGLSQSLQYIDWKQT